MTTDVSNGLQAAGSKMLLEAHGPISFIMARFWKGDFSDNLLQLSQPGEKPLPSSAEALKQNPCCPRGVEIKFAGTESLKNPF